MQPRLAWLPLITVLVLAGCAHEPEIRDSAPQVDRRVLMNLPDQVPKVEPVTRAGNSNPYTVLKKTYHLLPTSEGYRAQGTASWYGTKFHGRNTANGEVYDMNALTAAHKTLPIPCYARVTNQLNQRSIIVRINDRGPFHGDRLIDLSYAGAVKLGFADQGTAPVSIEVITPAAKLRSAAITPGSRALSKPVPRRARTSPVTSSYSRAPNSARRSAEITPPQPTPAAPNKVASAGPRTQQAVSVANGQQWYLQAGAFLDEPTAERLRRQLSYITSLPVLINASAEDDATIYRVKIGPSQDQEPLLKLQQEMRAVELGSPFMVSQRN